ncbi:CDP-glycerol glycerophosphotransferase family protein [Oceanobacillus picturae]|nr:CDP-glycerol glycerophosphotransferase family protein [Oceanobacillus picturae]
MHHISIVNNNGRTRFLISNLLSFELERISLGGLDLNFHFESVGTDKTAIVFDRNFENFAPNAFYNIEFYNAEGRRHEISLNDYGNFPVCIEGERVAICSQLETDEHIKLKFIDLKKVVFQMKYHPPITSEISIKNEGDFIEVGVSDLNESHYNNVMVSVDKDGSFDSYLVPVLIKKGHIYISNELYTKGYNLHLLVAINSNVFEATLIKQTKESHENVSYGGLPEHLIGVTEEEFLRHNINNVVSLKGKHSSVEVNEIDIVGNSLIFNMNQIEWFIDTDTPILILQETKTKQLYSVRGNLDSSKLHFKLDGFINEIPNKKEKWIIYLMSKGNEHAFRIRGNIEEGAERNFHILSQDNFPSLSTYNLHSALCMNKNNNLEIRKDKISNLVKNNFKIKTKVNKLKMFGEKVSIEVQLNTPYVQSIKPTNIYLVHRNKDTFNKVNMQLTNTTIKKNSLILITNIQLREVVLFPLYWDLFIGLEIDGKEELVKITKVSKDALYKVDSRISKYQRGMGKGKIFYPYITISKDLAFTVRDKEYFENRYYLLKEKFAFLVVNLFRKHFANKEIWIGFEKLAMSAHESGYYFFDYVYKNRKHDNFYYVIRKDSPELVNLMDKKDKVIYFMSLKYFIYMFAADLLISSDTKRNSYSLKQKKSILGKELTDKQLVYLQHGVNGLKAVPDFYKDRGVFDLVIAPSEYEKNMITEYWGYSEEEVVTTGLARWDVLEDRTNEIDYKQIFVMPTWRTWMDGMSKEEFLESDYYKYYNDFLSSNRLHKVLKDNNIKIMFFLHPKFKDYIDLFEINSPYIEKFGFLEVPLDEMIMKSSMMISDYSSVIWEMFYLEKPCLFYHFDVEKYLQYEGSYMDFKEDLFGDVAYDSEELVENMEQYILRNFSEKVEYSNLREKYFTYMDNQNSKRIFEAIENNKSNLRKKRKRTKRKLSHIIPFDVRRKMLNTIAKIKY